MRVAIETAICHDIAAHRIYCLGAHLAELTTGNVEEVRTSRGDAPAELGARLFGVARDDQARISGVYRPVEALERPRLGVNRAVHAGSSLGSTFGYIPFLVGLGFRQL